MIDAKNYKGRLESRDKGGWFTRDDRLYVNGRDQTHLAENLEPQVKVVRTALGDEHEDVPIWSMLCFIGVDAGLLARPFVIKGVKVTWPRAMQKTVGASGPISTSTIQSISRILSARLPAA